MSKGYLHRLAAVLYVHPWPGQGIIARLHSGALIGAVKKRKIQERRIQMNAGLRAHQAALSETSLRTGNVKAIVEYLKVAIMQSDVEKGRWSGAIFWVTSPDTRSETNYMTSFVIM